MALPPVSVVKTMNLVIYHGQDLYFPVTFWLDKDAGIPWPLTGITASAKVRDTFNPTTSAVIATLTCTIPTPANGQVLVQLPKATTAGLQLVGALDSVRIGDLGPWDFEMTDGTYSFRYIEGLAKLSREATR